MENQKLCQSCAMPLSNDEDFGTNADGNKNGDYCKYCFEGGKFSVDCTIGEMIETCVPFCLEAGAYKDADEARVPCGSYSRSSNAGRRRRH